MGMGITFLLMDMDTPGVSIAPIITLAGDHEVKQVFFDNVRVPKANRLGEENAGWTVAKYLLEFERGGGSAAGLKVSLGRRGPWPRRRLPTRAQRDRTRTSARQAGGGRDHRDDDDIG